MQIIGFQLLAIYSAAFFGLSNGSLLFAEIPGQNRISPVAIDAQLSAKLLQNYRSSVMEKPLRDTLDSLSEATGINICLDRRIDPSTLITSGTEGRTLYQAIVACASSAGASIGIVDNVVLVGRKDWVTQVIGAALASPKGDTPKNVAIDVQWPDLTTPTSAAALCGATKQRPLPHDLWPAVRWTKVDGRLALLLVAAQFDLMPAHDSGDTYDPIVVRSSVSASYPLDRHADAMRAATLDADPRAQINKKGKSQLQVTGTAAAHLATMNAWLSNAAGANPEVLNVDKVKFSIDLKNAVAGQVFAQLSGTAGRALVITPEAAEPCKQTVSLTTKDTTLRELSEQVAVLANVSLIWTDTELKVTTRK